MAKDPAVLFYTSDFLSGTMTMTDEQVGKYIRLLCLQHQKGFLTDKDMTYICKTYDEDVYSKFVVEDGKYYNLRMKDEADKRRNYAESRRNNRMKKDMLNISSTYVKHMENENESINEDIVIKDKSKPKDVLVVIEYGKELNLTISECESFFDYYTANGWKVGKNSMKDWKSALRNWKRNANKWGKNAITSNGVKKSDVTARATYEKSPEQVEQDIRNTTESLKLLRRERG